MAKFFGAGGLNMDPEIISTLEGDYWEELTKVNEAFIHEPDIAIRKAQRSVISNGQLKKFNNDGKEIHELSVRNSSSKVYPYLPSTQKLGFNTDLVKTHGEEVEKFVEYRSVGVQTDGNFDEEPELKYRCCCCFRTSTPWVVWVFVFISIIFFKMGAIITGRWIYLSSSSFDEVVFYIAFTVCLGFATIYFRRGTKYHNPFDLLFLILTVPIMWALLTFTTVFFKKDIFFYIGSWIYSLFIVPYTALGCYIAYRFWKQGKLFLRRVEGNKDLESYCRKSFFTQSLIMFNMQLTICAAIVSMAPTINQDSTIVWISSLILAPISILFAVVALVIGYFAIRKERRRLTYVFTGLSMNQFLLVLSMLLKRPSAPGIYFTFINTVLVFSITALTICHILMLLIVWVWIVPSYGRGLKGPVNRTSRNNCIQCAEFTICR